MVDGRNRIARRRPFAQRGDRPRRARRRHRANELVGRAANIVHIRVAQRDDRIAGARLRERNRKRRQPPAAANFQKREIGERRVGHDAGRQHAVAARCDNRNTRPLLLTHRRHHMRIGDHEIRTNYEPRSGSDQRTRVARLNDDRNANGALLSGINAGLRGGQGSREQDERNAHQRPHGQDASPQHVRRSLRPRTCPGKRSRQ